eukprot:XP_017951965.1 PREDICTED: cathepsin S-like [Xenopus tropicalis]
MGPSSICLVALLSLLIPAHSAPDPTLDTHWQLWVKTHQKSYKDGEEERARRTIWEETLKFISVHNLEYSLGLHTYEVGMNHLGDMVSEEVAATMTGYTGSGDSLANMSHVPKEILEALAPPSIDWRTQNCVTPVRDQGSFCRSCYAFSAVGALECQWKKKTVRLVTFSPQELVDCSDGEGNHGCNGGKIEKAFKYMKKYGVMEESAYPYTGQKGLCRKKQPGNIGVVKAIHDLPSGNETLLMNTVGTIGPVSVSINASSEKFHQFKSGVYYNPDCLPNKVNHAVLVVGYGKENGMDYWLVKNSWGVQFGENGYIKMARNRGNNCGIATRPVYATV